MISEQQYTELHAFLRQLVSPTLQPTRYAEFAKVEAYWHIGRIIVETEQAGQVRADYGIHLVEELADRLTKNFGRGYGVTNLWRFKQFYLAFQILPTQWRELPSLRNTLRQELTWSHYRLLMQLTNSQERAFYLQQAADEQWSVRLLQKLIRSRYYFQIAKGENTFPDKQQISKLTTTANDSEKDTKNTQHRRTRVANLKKVLLERYVGYAFIGQRQYVSVEGQDYWIDLVFYQVVLQRYLLIQLAEHDPAATARFRELADTYKAKLPPGTTSLPIGLLVNKKGIVKIITSANELSVQEEFTRQLPTTLPI